MARTDITDDLLTPPPLIASPADAPGRDGFRLIGDLVEAQFFRRSPVLYVTFDNLATVGKYDPPQPWLHVRMARAGFSVLGMIASRKDWYRNADTPHILSGLQRAGFFEGFRRVVFTGTSMGGFAALTYARLVPGSVVLALSPQTSLNRTVAPFETRFPYAYRKWDWDSPEFLDAAAAVPEAAEVWVVYDPFVAEDRTHAERIRGAHVRHVSCGHFGHRVIRQLKACGALDQLFDGIGEGRFDEAAFRRTLRARRGVRTWQKDFLENIEARGHARLALGVARRLLRDDPGARFAEKTVQRLQGPVPDAPVPPPPPEEILVTEGDPRPPFRGAILRVRNAIVVPERDHDRRLASGVLLADRSHCELSRAWIRAGKSTPAPVLSAGEPVERLAGRHLFAGHLRGHFGHFLVESTARLWALSRLEDQVESLLYLPYRGAPVRARRALARMEPFFRQLGIAVPIRIVAAATEVEDLFVPELGFGWRDSYAGSPAYRTFMRQRLGAGIAPEGAERLYVSRARLPSQRGGILGETVIEANLERQGYEVFHPERHPLEVQIARYKAARQIVALDGSALHLAAYVLPPDSRVGIVLRRSRANTDDYVLQYRSFCGVDPDVIDVVRKDWISGDARRPDFRSVGELDFAALFAQLAALGYVAPDFVPDLPSEAEIAAMLAEFSARRSEDFAPAGAGDEEEDENGDD